MSGEKEINLPDYISFAYNRFLMTRVEYLIFTQNEQEAKVLRIIEWCIENERARLYREAKARTPQGEEVKIPEIIFVPISHRFFLSQLQGTIQSETTLKEVLISLEKKYLIFEREGGSGPYDPNLYTINKHRLATLTALLPPSLDQVDMIAVMKQPRVVRKMREGQFLTPSKIDPLVMRIREAIIAPLDPQLLALYAPIIDPLSRSRGGQKLTPKRYIDSSQDKYKESGDGDDAIAHHTPTICQESENHHDNTDNDNHSPATTRSSAPALPQHQQETLKERGGAPPDLGGTQVDEREELDSGVAGGRGGTNEVHRHGTIILPTQEPPVSAGLYESDQYSSYSLTNRGKPTMREEGPPAHRAGRSSAATVQQPHQGHAQKSTGRRSDPLDSLPEEIKAIILEWQRASGDRAITAKVREHAATLADKYKALPGEVEGCVKWLLDNDERGIFKQRPLYLGDVVNGLPSYRRVMNTPQKDESPPPCNEGLVFGHDLAFWTEEELSKVKPFVGRAIRNILAGRVLSSQQISYAH